MKRRAVRELLPLIAVASVLLGVNAASGSHPPTQLQFACALKSNGVLRYVSDLSQCRARQEDQVTVWPGPTLMCVKSDGSVRFASNPNQCQTGPPGNRGTTLSVPATTGTPSYFCANTTTGVLRNVPTSSSCTGSETALQVSNHNPTDISLSSSSVAENQPAGTTVGTFGATDPDPAATFAYSLVSGTGSTDNGSFSIDGTALKTAASFDYEAKNSYSIRVRVTDGYGGSYEEQLTISVTDVAEDNPPVAVDDAATVAEDSAATAIDVLANDSDGGDGGPVSIQSTSDPANGTVVITGGGSGLTYAPDANYCNIPPARARTALPTP